MSHDTEWKRRKNKSFQSVRTFGWCGVPVAVRGGPKMCVVKGGNRWGWECWGWRRTRVVALSPLAASRRTMVIQSVKKGDGWISKAWSVHQLRQHHNLSLWNVHTLVSVPLHIMLKQTCLVDVCIEFVHWASKIRLPPLPHAVEESAYPVAQPELQDICRDFRINKPNHLSRVLLHTRVRRWCKSFVFPGLAPRRSGGRAWQFRHADSPSPNDPCLPPLM